MFLKRDKDLDYYGGHSNNFRSKFPMDHNAVTVDASERYQFIKNRSSIMIIINSTIIMADLISSFYQIILNSPKKCRIVEFISTNIIEKLSETTKNQTRGLFVLFCLIFCIYLL